MLGDVAAAEENLQRAREALARNPDSRRVEEGYLNMRARHLIETGATPQLELARAGTVAGSHPNWVATVGMIAATNGNPGTARDAVARLAELGAAAAAGGRSHEARRLEVLELEVAALAAAAAGNTERAAVAARQAAEAEMELGAPSGPPDPIKPAWELYGEVLLGAGRAADAMAAFEQSLQWIPQRTPSLLGLARAATATGDESVAATSYRTIVDMPGMHSEGIAVREALAGIGDGGR
ncbi:MAG: hypothetical protein U5K76_10510 [Woeseiaceae bacterium]|nr:hypothetical protein [Woeseiaceae bacterium]